MHGPGAVRGVLVEAAWVAARTPGPLRAFWERTAAKRGAKIATVALARKHVVLVWQLLTKREDYAFNRPAALAGKLPLSSCWPAPSGGVVAARARASRSRPSTASSTSSWPVRPSIRLDLHLEPTSSTISGMNESRRSSVSRLPWRLASERRATDWVAVAN
jgi:hypothetical protein